MKGQQLELIDCIQRHNETAQNQINQTQVTVVEKPARLTQRDRLRLLFEENIGKWIPLPQIQALGIAMYPPRIKELRDEGMNIINKEERINGVNHSWYMFVI